MSVSARHPEVSDEVIAEAVSRELDQYEPVGRFAPGEQVVERTTGAEIVAFPKWHQRAGVRAVFAIAALFVLFIGANVLIQPIAWNAPVIGQDSAYRMENEVELPQRYSEQDVAGVFHVFQSSVNEAYKLDERMMPLFRMPGRDWTCSADIQEMPNGRLSVKLSAESGKDDTVVRTWTEYFDDLDDFKQNAHDFGTYIGEQLSTCGDDE